MVKSNDIKKQLSKKVKSFGNAALWSYSADSLPEILPDWLIAQWIMIYGDDNDYKQLKSLFEDKYLERVWEDKIVRSDFFMSYNERICRELFNIEEPEKYISEIKDNAISRILEGSY